MTKQTCEIEKLLMGTPEDILIGIVMLFKTYGAEELWDMKMENVNGNRKQGFYFLPFETKYNSVSIYVTSGNFCIADTIHNRLAICRNFLHRNTISGELYINLDENE